MEIDKLFLLKKLIDDSHSFGAVITFDRRYSEIDMKHKREAFEQYRINIIGVKRNSITGIDDNRGKKYSITYLVERRNR